MREDLYRGVNCPNCGRRRVDIAGVCEKCFWDVDANGYAHITRPESYRIGHNGIEYVSAELKILEQKEDEIWEEVMKELFKEQSK